MSDDKGSGTGPPADGSGSKTEIAGAGSPDRARRSALRRAVSRFVSLSAVGTIVYSAVAILMALAVGGLLIWLFGYDVGPAFSSLVRGAFGDLYAISQTLTRTTPILFAGLAVMVAFRVGLFNIGGEGQLYWGALATALVAAHLAGLPIVVVVAAAMGAGALAGALWGAIPGALKAYTGAHEVITTIMLNTIAILGTAHLTQTYFKAEGPVDQTERIPMPARMPELIPGTDITFGILIGIVIVALLHRLFTSTAVGYDFQAVGYSPGAAQYGGIRGRRVIVGAMALGGAMAGLAGGSVVMTQLFRFVSGFSPGYGFTGIAVAVLGRNNAWGVLLASLLFGALQAGGMSMQLFADIPSDLMTVVQGLVILFVAAPGLARLLQRLVRRREALGGSHVE